jgi:hypothetical protein
MKISSAVVYELHDALAKGLKLAIPGFTDEQAWVFAKKQIDCLATHPTLKISRVGVRSQAVDTKGGDNV